MRLVRADPPLFAEIDAAFNIAGKPILFAWGDKIYCRHVGTVRPELMAHEAVHGERQGADIEGWWRRYIVDPQFRLEEEIPAHIAEFKAICNAQRTNWVSERNMRRTYATHVARKLAAPLYGNLISVSAAKDLILAA